MHLADDFLQEENYRGWRPERHRVRSKAHSLWKSDIHKPVSENWKTERSKTDVQSFSVRCSHVSKEESQTESYIKWATLAADEFVPLVLKWRKETKHYSSVTKMVMHPSYLRIIGLGRQILPLLLKELEARPDHWLVALNAITGEDPASLDSTFQQAVDAWIDWGRKRGYLR